MNQSSKSAGFLSGLTETIFGVLAVYGVIRWAYIWLPLLLGFILLREVGVIPAPPAASDADVCCIAAALVEHHDGGKWDAPTWANRLIIQSKGDEYVVFGGCRNYEKQLVYKLSMDYQSGDPRELSSWKIRSLDYKKVGLQDYVDDGFLENVRW